MAFLETRGPARRHAGRWSCPTTAPARRAGRLGMVNAMGPYNLRPRADRRRRSRASTTSAGPTRIPTSRWAGRWPPTRRCAATSRTRTAAASAIRWSSPGPRASPRAASCATSSATPAISRRPCSTSSASTPPEAINGVPQMPLEGDELRREPANAAAPSKAQAAVLRDVRPSRPVAGRLEGRVPSIRRATPSRATSGSSTISTSDFTEADDLADAEPAAAEGDDRRAGGRQAEAHQVLPLDDRFAPRFAENAARCAGPSQAVRVSCRYGPCADRRCARRAQPQLHDRGRCRGRRPATEGVLIAHGDMTSGYSLYVQGRPSGARHQYRRRRIKSCAPLPRCPAGNCRLGFRMLRVENKGTGTLLIDGDSRRRDERPTTCFACCISWSGLDIGRDRGSPSRTTPAPTPSPARSARSPSPSDDDQSLDGEATGRAEMGRQ